MKRLIIALTALILAGCGTNNNTTPKNNQQLNTNVLPSEANTNNTTEENAPNNQINGTTNTNNSSTSNNAGLLNNLGMDDTLDQEIPGITDTEIPPSETPTQNTNQTVAQQTYEKITKGIAVQDVTMGEELFRDTYELDPDLLSSYIVCMPTNNAKPIEIAVFELKNETSSDAVKLSIENRIEALNQQFGEQNFQIAEKNNVIVFIMSPQAEQMIQNFAAE